MGHLVSLVMLTFFRHIRKELLNSRSLSRYLLYAVGEIALVVIGILIALQINNLNEQSKERAVERSYLENIKSDLVRDTLGLVDIIADRKAKN